MQQRLRGTETGGTVFEDVGEESEKIWGMKGGDEWCNGEGSEETEMGLIKRY